MKRTLYFSILTFLVLITACNKETDVITSFPFTVESNYKENIVINTLNEISFDLKPEHIVTSNVYTMSYRLLSGKGSFYLQEDSIISPDETTELNKLNFKLFFKGEIAGNIEVQVTFSDQQGEEETVNLNFISEHNPYTLEATAPVDQANINEERAISISLYNIGKDQNVTYDRAFYIIQGKGELYNADSSEKIALDTFNSLSQGTFNYNLKFTEFGESKFVVSTRDSNGQVKNDTLLFNINPINISFTATPEVNTPFIGNEFNVNFDLSESQGNGGQYRLRYVIDEGSIIMKSGGTILSPGTLYDVPLGNFSWQATGNNIEQVKLTFIVRNTSNSEVLKEVSFTVVDGSFTFEASPTTNESNIESAVRFNALITEKGPSSRPYSLRFTSSGSGFMTYNGETFTSGQIISNIVDVTFPFDYTGLTAGTHNIEFTLVNANGQPTTSKASIVYTASNFNFTGTAAANNVSIESSINLNFLIDEIDAGQNYQMRYVKNNGDFTIKENENIRNAGIQYVVPSGEFNWTLEPTSAENIEVTFFVTNNNRVEKQVLIKLDVIDTAFDYELITKNTIPTSDKSTIELKLEGSTQQNYTISYNIFPADGSTLFVAGSMLQQNKSISLGSLLMDFNFKKAREYEIEYIVNSSLGKNVIKSSIINVTQSPFNLNIVNNSTVLVDEPLDFNLSLSGNSNLNYVISYRLLSGSGSISLTNNSTLPLGSTSFTYTPSLIGTSTIEFVITDNFGSTQTLTKNITVKNPAPKIVSFNQVRYQIGTSNTSSSWDCSDVPLSPRPWYDEARKCNYSIIIDNINFQSPVPITKYRYRADGYNSPEYNYEINNGYLFLHIGKLIKDTDNQTGTPPMYRDDNDTKIKQNSAYELQIQGSNGVWSDWFPVISPSYPTT